MASLVVILSRICSSSDPMLAVCLCLRLRIIIGFVTVRGKIKISGELSLLFIWELYIFGGFLLVYNVVNIFIFEYSPQIEGKRTKVCPIFVNNVCFCFFLFRAP